jgi:hypothetical protein
MTEVAEYKMLEENYAIVTEEDLLRKVSDTENNFIERKTISNTRDWLETAVAFANSCPVGQPGILYVNVDDNGAIIPQLAEYDFEKLQKSISKKIGESWPTIYFVTHILNKNGHEFIAVVVYGSQNRPHFAGRAFVRVGPENRDASEKQYDSLVAQRNRKFRALEKLVGKEVFLFDKSGRGGSGLGECIEANEFYLTIRAAQSGGQQTRCIPVEWITISFEPRNNRPQLILDFSV